MEIAPKDSKEMRQELLGVLLPHRRKLFVASPDERFEPGGLDSFLENWSGRVMRQKVGWVLRHV